MIIMFWLWLWRLISLALLVPFGYLNGWQCVLWWVVTGIIPFAALAVTIGAHYNVRTPIHLVIFILSGPLTLLIFCGRHTHKRILLFQGEKI
jgi:hypothetical protein